MPNNALILAKDLNNIIAINGRLPWRCQADIDHFRQVSLQFDFILMGRTTYHSLIEASNKPNPLPKRRCLVITNSPEKYISNQYVRFISSEEARAILSSPAFCLIIGGAQTALSLLDYIDSVFLSIITLPVKYTIQDLKKANTVTYWDHNLKAGQYINGREKGKHNRKNKFDLDREIIYPSFTLQIWERKGPYLEKYSVNGPEIDLNDPMVKERKCLYCMTTFISSWVGNRICNICKDDYEFKAGAELPEETYLP